MRDFKLVIFFFDSTRSSRKEDTTKDKKMEIFRKRDEIIVERYPVEASEGLLSARKVFGDLRFRVTLEQDEHLELVVNGAVNLRHPAAKKTAKKKPKKKDDDAENEEPPPRTTTKTTTTKSDDEQPTTTTKKKKKSLVEEEEEPLSKKKKKKESLVEKEEEEPLPKKKKVSLKEIIYPSPKKEKKKREAEDSEEEWEPDEVKSDDKKEEEEETSSPPPEARREWTSRSESVMMPDEEDSRGDEWNEASAPCREIMVSKALGPRALAEKFHEQGLLVLDSAKYSLPSSTTKRMKDLCQQFYEKKVREAQAENLTTKKKPHHLAVGNEETIAGFNQRPGGRVDMVLDELKKELFGKEEKEEEDQIVKGILEGEKSKPVFPFEPVVRAILGSKSSWNYVGCVVARPGDKNQNWHIDGVHTDKTEHRKADRIICFVPLTDLTEATGTTEMIPTSHFHSRDDSKATGFHKVSSLPRARHYLHAGTPIIMDYRLWHRGLGNNSQDTRYLLYTVFQKEDHKRQLEDLAGPLDKFIRAS